MPEISKNSRHEHGSPQKLFQGGKLDILLNLSMLLTIQCKCTITKMTPAMQGRNEWGLGGHHSPGITMGALNHCGGRHKVPTMSQILSSMQYICFRKTSGSNMVAPNLLLAQWRSQPKNLGGQQIWGAQCLILGE